MPKHRIAALILAAGRSSRMGALKQLLPVQKTTLLEHVINNVSLAHVDKVYCVIGAEAASLRPHLQKHAVDIINNPNFDDGLSSSIKCGIEQIQRDGFEATLIALGDQPLIPSDFFNALISIYHSTSHKIVATDYGGHYGVPTVISKYYYPNLLALQGDQGAKQLLISQPHTSIALETDTLLDIDTKKDYEELLNRIEKS